MRFWSRTFPQREERGVSGKCDCDDDNDMTDRQTESCQNTMATARVVSYWKM